MDNTYRRYGGRWKLDDRIMESVMDRFGDVIKFAGPVWTDITAACDVKHHIKGVVYGYIMIEMNSRCNKKDLDSIIKDKIGNSLVSSYQDHDLCSVYVIEDVDLPTCWVSIR